MGRKNIRSAATEQTQLGRYRSSLTLGAWSGPALVFVLACGLAAAASDPGLLAPGVPVRRQIQRGEVHAYQLLLKANQFARIEVRQREIDVALSLRKPTGQP